MTFRTPVNFIGLFSGRHRRLATQSSCGEANVFGTIKFCKAEQSYELIIPDNRKQQRRTGVRLRLDVEQKGEFVGMSN